MRTEDLRFDETRFAMSPQQLHLCSDNAQSHEERLWTPVATCVLLHGQVHELLLSGAGHVADLAGHPAFVHHQNPV